MIKIDPKLIPNEHKVRSRTKKISSPDFSQSLKDSSTQAVLANQLESPFVTVSSMVNLLSLNDSSQSKNIDRAEYFLDLLDEWHKKLLFNEIKVEPLKNLHDLIKKELSHIADPALQEILKQIEERVAVELAKLEILT